MPTNNEMFTAPEGHVLAHNKNATSGRGVHVMPLADHDTGRPEFFGPAEARGDTVHTRRALCGQWQQRRWSNAPNPDYVYDPDVPQAERPSYWVLVEPHYRHEVPAVPASMVCSRCARKAAELEAGDVE